MDINILNSFRLHKEQEDYNSIIKQIENDTVFKGTNLWVLIFAIFVASIGLNVNSTAVIIGAMLISPLMGPIMGIGMGMAINDTVLLRKALKNFILATLVGLATSTIYFLISPLNEAHSEILARTSPNIYDVLIAFFGGLAGIVATSSKKKGNVIPGVAIATALMPPLCTAGYGLATLNPNFFFGALYLFLINSVFIALSTLLTVRILKFPFKHLPDPKDELKAKRIVWITVILTLLPSIYFSYNIVKNERFVNFANSFIKNEAVIQDNYLLNKEINPQEKTISLTFGGNQISNIDISTLRAKLKSYKLDHAILNINQGFSYSASDIGNKQLNLLSKRILQKDSNLNVLKIKLDSTSKQESLNYQIFAELKIQYPIFRQAIIHAAYIEYDTTSRLTPVYFVFLKSKSKFKALEKNKIEEWLKVRLKCSNIKLIIEE